MGKVRRVRVSGWGWGCGSVSGERDTVMDRGRGMEGYGVWDGGEAPVCAESLAMLGL